MGSAADVRFSLSAAMHAPPGLHRRYTTLKEESAKVRGGGCVCVCVCGSPWGIWGQFGRVSGSSYTDDWRVVQSLAQPSPLSMTAASLGLGLLLAATAVTHPPTPTLTSASQWARGRGYGRRPVVPEAPPQHVCVCLGVHHSFWWPERGLEG